MQHTDIVAVVEAWQDAANRQDIDRLMELSDPNIEMIGPRGSGYGRHLLRDWLQRAGLTLETRRMFVRDTVVVVAQHGVWRSAETSDVVGEADVASRFRVEGRRIVQFKRYDSLASALAEAGFGQSDEIEDRRSAPASPPPDA
ncbi:MAG TPA: nuclear transport factor 2 family protein [Herpetosiphonaceae bacterium]